MVEARPGLTLREQFELFLQKLQRILCYFTSFGSGLP